jgi:hypothetical protein
MRYSLRCYIIFSIDIFSETIDNFYMKRLIISFAVFASLFLLSCDTTSNRECNRIAMNELIFISFQCSDPIYVADNGYGTYDNCMDKNLNIVEWAIISCKGRDGVFP